VLLPHLPLSLLSCQAREEIRVLRAELSVLRMEATEASMARAEAEAKQVGVFLLSFRGVLGAGGRVQRG
jgi:hypothetical protein